MPKLRAFSVRDQKAEAYLRPFFAPTAGMAIRSFSDAVNDESQEMCRHADDYTLFEIGEFDEMTGTFTPCVPKSLGNALEYKKVTDIRDVQRREA